jgi:hypothetical protein
MGETGTTYSDKKKKSNRAEAEAAAKLGGRRTKQSGGRAWAKDHRETEGTDGETPQLAFEHKRIDRDTKSMRIEKKWLEGIAIAAKRKMKDPALVLLFEGTQQAPDEWVMVPMEVARRLLGLNVESSKP